MGCLLLLLMAACLAMAGAEEGDKRVLVLLESHAIKETHSIYFKALASEGLVLTFKTADDPSIVLKKYGEYLFDHLLLLAPSVEEFGGTLTVEGVTEFIDDGGNVLVAGSSHTSDVLRDIATECGLEMDEEGTSVIDHMNFELSGDEGKHTLIVADPESLIKSMVMVGAGKVGPLLYRGTGLIVDQSNPLVMEVLTASSSAYSHDPDKPITRYPHSTGKNTVLLAALQARNNARVVFSGSLDFFSDAFFRSPVQKTGDKAVARAGNEAVAIPLTLWCFKHSGVLRVNSVDHHLAGSKNTPNHYTITDDVIYTINIEEFKDRRWVPFQGQDVQMEFHRIDPFVRQTLKNNNGKFEARFKLPDVYGVFQFKVDYRKMGYTRLYSTTQVSVRPLRHDQYERFIPAAYPYYASSFSMMFGVAIFSMVFLHFKDDEKKSKKE